MGKDEAVAVTVELNDSSDKNEPELVKDSLDEANDTVDEADNSIKLEAESEDDAVRERIDEPA